MALARVFDHGPMKLAADKKVAELNASFKEQPPEGPERMVSYHFYNVADVFAQAQYHRTEADYNTCVLRTAVGHLPSASRGISHSCQFCFTAPFSFSRNGSSCSS